MRATMPSYGQKCDFQYGGGRHLGFCRIRVLRVKVVQGPYSQCLHQIWCESVQKWRRYGRLTDLKMAAAAILNCYLVTKSTSCPEHCVKIALLLSEIWPFEHFANLA